MQPLKRHLKIAGDSLVTVFLRFESCKLLKLLKRIGGGAGYVGTLSAGLNNHNICGEGAKCATGMFVRDVPGQTDILI